MELNTLHFLLYCHVGGTMFFQLMNAFNTVLDDQRSPYRVDKWRSFWLSQQPGMASGRNQRNSSVSLPQWTFTSDLCVWGVKKALKKTKTHLICAHSKKKKKKNHPVVKEGQGLQMPRSEVCQQHMIQLVISRDGEDEVYHPRVGYKTTTLRGTRWSNTYIL